MQLMALWCYRCSLDAEARRHLCRQTLLQSLALACFRECCRAGPGCAAAPPCRPRNGMVLSQAILPAAPSTSTHVYSAPSRAVPRCPLAPARFANGVALSRDESFALVAETYGMRVHKVHLEGDKASRTTAAGTAGCIADGWATMGAAVGGMRVHAVRLKGDTVGPGEVNKGMPSSVSGDRGHHGCARGVQACCCTTHHAAMLGRLPTKLARHITLRPAPGKCSWTTCQASQTTSTERQVMHSCPPAPAAGICATSTA